MEKRSEREWTEGLRLWNAATEEEKAEVLKIAGSDLVEATAEDDPPPFPLHPITVRQYAIILLGQTYLDETCSG